MKRNDLHKADLNGESLFVSMLHNEFAGQGNFHGMDASLNLQVMMIIMVKTRTRVKQTSLVKITGPK